MQLPVKSERVKSLLWFGLSTVIFAFLTRMAEFDKIMDALSQAEPVYLLFSGLAGASVFLVWSANWYNFFSISNIKCSYSRTVQLFSAGQFLNSVTPFGQFGGQPFMAYLISSRSDTSYEKSLATVMSADLIALIPLTTFVLTGYSYLAFTGDVSSKLTHMSAVTFSLLLFGVTMIYIGWYRNGSLEKTVLTIFEKMTEITGIGEHLVEKLESKLENIEKTFKTVGENPSAVLISLGIAHLSFLMKMAAFYGVLLSLGIEMSFVHLMLLIPLSALANFSITPGGAGTFEAVMAGLIMLFINIEFATALIAAILYRASTYWLGIIIGYLGMTSLNYNLSSAKAVKENIN
ncbi:MAG: lysylphosphatidylglycerol synthase transmembrane domain-containing protein [Candidatus Nanohalobium sp.]